MLTFTVGCLLLGQIAGFSLTVIVMYSSEINAIFPSLSSCLMCNPILKSAFCMLLTGVELMITNLAHVGVVGYHLYPSMCTDSLITMYVRMTVDCVINPPSIVMF